MYSPSLLRWAIALIPSIFGWVTANADPADTCRSMEQKLHGVFFPGTPQYAAAIDHWTNSSSQHATCAFVPQDVHDLSAAIKILGTSRTPFAIRGGGHAINNGFSSTTGVQISMSNFNEVKYDSKTSTARIGAGQIWNSVYALLGPDNVNVVGGRVSAHVGVGGFITGGGYSWLTNQHGLTIDTVRAFDLVLPNGTFVVVTQSSHPDLFFGLKGGYNNFGIVTGYTLKAFPQEQVWGGPVLYTGDKFPAITQATSNFIKNVKDTRACLIPVYAFVQGSFTIQMLLFYDGPTPPKGIFDEFFTIPSTQQDVSTRSFASLVESMPFPGSPRAVFHTVSVLDFSPKILDLIANETTFWGEKLASSSVTLVSYDVEPLMPSFISHRTESAYPHDTPLQPINLYWTWTDHAQNKTVIDAMKQSAERIYEAALAEGQDISIEQGKQIRYPNYCMWDMPLEQMYGGNVERLRDLRANYDKHNVMGLTGGFRF